VRRGIVIGFASCQEDLGMPVVIAGTINLDPARREQAIAAARELMQATRKEPGCIAYVFSGDFEDPGCFRLFEEWESQAALELHFKAPHMAKFQAQVPQLGIRGMKVERYETTSKGPLGAPRRG
jgi:quinol monooxygenase YgiN